jgi:hypothetical protein
VPARPSNATNWITLRQRFGPKAVFVSLSSHSKQATAKSHTHRQLNGGSTERNCRNVYSEVVMHRGAFLTASAAAASAAARKISMQRVTPVRQNGVPGRSTEAPPPGLVRCGLSRSGRHRRLDVAVRSLDERASPYEAVNAVLLTDRTNNSPRKRPVIPAWG